MFLVTCFLICKGLILERWTFLGRAGGNIYHTCTTTNGGGGEGTVWTSAWCDSAVHGGVLVLCAAESASPSSPFLCRLSSIRELLISRTCYKFDRYVLQTIKHRPPPPCRLRSRQARIPQMSGNISTANEFCTCLICLAACTV